MNDSALEAYNLAQVKRPNFEMVFYKKKYN